MTPHWFNSIPSASKPDVLDIGHEADGDQYLVDVQLVPILQRDAGRRLRRSLRSFDPCFGMELDIQFLISLLHDVADVWIFIGQ